MLHSSDIAANLRFAPISNYTLFPYCARHNVNTVGPMIEILKLNPSNGEKTVAQTDIVPEL